MEEFEFTEAEQAVINAAIAAGGAVWENENIEPIKRRIKQHYRDEGGEVCCYCRRDLTDEFNMVIDIEHILPKSVFEELMFKLFNLNISCKRCNMRIKRERTDFLHDIHAARMNPDRSEQYLMIHPNLDEYDNHIDYIMFRRANKRFVKYLQLTDKGRFTYSFFELQKMEIAALNAAQGLGTEGTQLSPEIPDNIAVAIQNLTDQL